jgi:peptidoglycan/LPS O-acetylase OafA/YrhL
MEGMRACGNYDRALAFRPAPAALKGHSFPQGIITLSSNVAPTSVEGEGNGRPHRAASPDLAGSFYLPELDMVLFFAFVGVFAYHGYIYLPRHALPVRNTVSTFFSANAFAVDLFFALSAYLITRLLLRERVQTGTVDVRAFYVRRILRIWPLYFFFLGLLLVLSRTFSSSNYYPMFAVKTVYLVTYALFVGNFAVARLGHPAYIIDPLWSISIEEQFYLLWPWAVRRVTERGVIRVAAALAAVGFLTRLALLKRGVNGDAFWFNSFVRIDPIAAGAFLAAMPISKFAKLRVSTRVTMVLASWAVWWLVAFFCPFTSEHVTAIQALVAYPAAVVASATMLAAVLGVGKGATLSPTAQWLVYWGKISYGLYVYHAFAIEMTRLLCLFLGHALNVDLRMLQVIYVLIGFPLTIVLAAMSYRWLEAPFLRLKRRFTHVESRPV